MSARRTILRQLKARHEGGDGSYLRPANINGFSAQPSRYQEAVNQLLQERLINGTRDEEGRMAIGLNTHRLAEIHKELRPVYARAGVWVACLIVVVVAVAAVGLLR